MECAAALGPLETAPLTLVVNSGVEGETVVERSSNCLRNNHEKFTAAKQL